MSGPASDDLRNETKHKTGPNSLVFGKNEKMCFDCVFLLEKILIYLTNLAYRYSVNYVPLRNLKTPVFTILVPMLS